MKKKYLKPEMCIVKVDPDVTLIIVSHYDDELPSGITHRLHLIKQAGQLSF